MYGFCDFNANAAHREYSRRFPNRRLPNKSIFSSTFQRLAVIPHADGTFAPLRNEERSSTILQYFDDSPSASVQRAEAELNVMPITV